MIHVVIWQMLYGKPERSDWFLFGPYFAIRSHKDRLYGNGHEPRTFVRESQQIHIEQVCRVPYNKLLTNLACSRRTREYWPAVVAARTRRISKKLLNLFQFHLHANDGTLQRYSEKKIKASVQRKKFQ